MILPTHLSRFVVRLRKRLSTRLFLEVWNHQVARPKSDLITSRPWSSVCLSRVLELQPTGLNTVSMHRAWPILLRPRLRQRHPS